MSSLTMFETRSGTVYHYDSATQLLSSSRGEDHLSDSGRVYRRMRVVVDMVDVRDFNVVEGERAEFHGSHPTDEGRLWHISTSPVKWLTVYKEGE